MNNKSKNESCPVSEERLKAEFKRRKTKQIAVGDVLIGGGAPVAVQSILLGGHVRVGFEDNFYYSRGVLAKSNAELVARVARIGSELGRTVATSDEARKLLGIPELGARKA